MIRFSKPAISEREKRYAMEALDSAEISGGGPFSEACVRALEQLTGAGKTLLTHSGTAALELAMLLAELRGGDEVIMPSFTFPSTANSVVLRGATPVFVDIREDTLNLDETRIEEALSRRTRMIVPVHYAGAGCQMDRILEIAGEHGLAVVEDAAQAIGASYQGRPLGTFGDFGAISFHGTKNLASGEAGALLIRNPEMFERSEIIHEKGTNRANFLRGEVDKYTWQDIGSSFPPSEITAAILLAQLERIDELTVKRLAIWDRYAAGFEGLEQFGWRHARYGPDQQANGHMFFLLAPGAAARDEALRWLRDRKIGAVSHYEPLHSSRAGQRYGKPGGDLSRTADLAGRLIRLPLHTALSEEEQEQVVSAVWEFAKR